MTDIRVMMLSLCLVTVAFGQQPVSERVTQLPELGNKYFLTAVFNDVPTEKDRAVMDLLDNDPVLAAVRAQTTFNTWTSSTPMVATTAWKSYLGDGRPAILLQRPSEANGTAPVIYFSSGESLVPSKLSERISQVITSEHARINGDCPRCPKPSPPTPDAPDSRPSPQVQIPVITPDDGSSSEDTEYTPLWLFLLPLAGAGIGLYQSVKSEPVR